jgi:Fis family transcriptional regulator
VVKEKKSTQNKKSQLMNGKLLRVHTMDALTNYFDSLNGQKPGDLYELVLGQVEEPLFKAVMKYTKGNQSQASEILGINRGTLRKKLKTYSITS